MASVGKRESMRGSKRESMRGSKRESMRGSKRESMRGSKRESMTEDITRSIECSQGMFDGRLRADAFIDVPCDQQISRAKLLTDKQNQRPADKQNNQQPVDQKIFTAFMSRAKALD
jgi:hypothetical protein